MTINVLTHYLVHSVYHVRTYRYITLKLCKAPTSHVFFVCGGLIAA